MWIHTFNHDITWTISMAIQSYRLQNFLIPKIYPLNSKNYAIPYNYIYGIQETINFVYEIYHWNCKPFSNSVQYWIIRLTLCSWSYYFPSTTLTYYRSSHQSQLPCRSIEGWCCWQFQRTWRFQGRSRCSISSLWLINFCRRCFHKFWRYCKYILPQKRLWH